MDALNPSDPPRPPDQTGVPVAPVKDNALNAVFASMTGMGADEHGTRPPGAAAESVQAGHEPDRFNARAILYVPLLVTLTALFAFGVITTLFLTIVRKAEPNANTDPQAAAITQQPINERFARISSTDPAAVVPQPRLEYMKQVENTPSDPAHYRSKRPLQEYRGATYEIYPEDLRPERFIDPTQHRKILIETGYVGKDKKSASAPINEMIILLSAPLKEAVELLTNSKELTKDEKAAAEAKILALRAKWLSNRKDGKNEADKGMLANTTPSDLRAKLSNSGRGGPSMPAAVKVEEKPAAHEPAKH